MDPDARRKDRRGEQGRPLDHSGGRRAIWWRPEGAPRYALDSRNRAYPPVNNPAGANWAGPVNIARRPRDILFSAFFIGFSQPGSFIMVGFLSKYFLSKY